MVKKQSSSSHASSAKLHLHTTLNPESIQILKKLSLEYGSYSAVIEEALQLMRVRHNFLDSTNFTNLKEYHLWHLMRNNFDMVAVGRTTFLSYIKNLPKEPQTQNNAIELIEWFHSTTIDQLSLHQILIAIKKLWLAGNYFTNVQIEILDKNPTPNSTLQQFRLIFYHDYNDQIYGKYWCEYFEQVMKMTPILCETKKYVRNGLFHIIFKQIGVKSKID